MAKGRRECHKVWVFAIRGCVWFREMKTKELRLRTDPFSSCYPLFSEGGIHGFHNREEQEEGERTQNSFGFWRLHASRSEMPLGFLLRFLEVVLLFGWLPGS